ncbi:MAG: MATE family efflux transporter [Candidatus Cloacimonetes bacterium]|jgi:putative MATE family efflux protein|nr:MATE family efflux transporter [Candidatus Cloacimonadota bacterium]
MKQAGMDLTSGGIYKNMMKLALPIMLSNFMMTFYNLTDAFWLGKLGENAMNAVSVAGIAFPLIFFLSSFGIGFVVAGTALISQFKGAGTPEMMKKVVGQFVLILIAFSIVFLTFSFLFLDGILSLLHVPDAIFEVSKQYISYILVGVFFMFIFLTYQSFAHGLGDTISPMKIQIISVSLNVVLDPIFIFGIGFMPRLETIGAAQATLISRIVAAGLALYFLKKKTSHIIPNLQEIKPDKILLKKILDISIPASIAHSITSFGFIILQGFVNTYGTLVISVFSIGNRMMGLFMMPAMGISNALATMVGQNLGAKKISRAVKSVKVGMVLVLLIMLVGCSLLYFFGSTLTRFFINDPAIVGVGERMFKVVSFAALIFSVLFVFMGVFNGSGHTKPTMVLNISRLWFLRIPLVFILSGKILEFAFIRDSFLNGILTKLSIPLSTHSYDALWWSMLISNVLTTLLAVIIYRQGKWKEGKI